ncbi:MAG: hypothetical protein EAZ91_15025 [Cytophagales bacterium]|nr:MAG: hypothetical protein EAZ91_15025 [Cytophagales bacterium]
MILELLKNPKRLFLIDSLGAMLTLFGLIGILLPLKKWFGMPRQTLLLLAVIALGLAIYSGCCLLFVKRNWRPFLKIVSVANLLYCALTAGMVITHYAQLTALGVAYFVAEIGIVCGLVYVEYQTIAQSE